METVTLGPFPYGNITSVTPTEVQVSVPFTGSPYVPTADGQTDIRVSYSDSPDQDYMGGSYKVMKINQTNGGFSYIPMVVASKQKQDGGRRKKSARKTRGKRRGARKSTKRHGRR